MANAQEFCGVLEILGLLTPMEVERFAEQSFSLEELENIKINFDEDLLRFHSLEDDFYHAGTALDDILAITEYLKTNESLLTTYDINSVSSKLDEIIEQKNVDGDLASDTVIFLDQQRKLRGLQKSLNKGELKQTYSKVQNINVKHNVKNKEEDNLEITEFLKAASSSGILVNKRQK